MVVKNDVSKAIKENKKSLKPSNINGFKDFICGTPEGTRTPDLLVRSQSLYPAELLAHVSLNIISQKKEFVNVISKKNIFFLFEIKNNRPQYRGLL